MANVTGERTFTGLEVTDKPVDGVLLLADVGKSDTTLMSDGLPIAFAFTVQYTEGVTPGNGRTEDCRLILRPEFLAASTQRTHSDHLAAESPRLSESLRG